MSDIARIAGVSISTVSKALSGSSLVRPATRARIEEIALAMNYGVDESARNLRLRANRTVSVVVPQGPFLRQTLSDPFCLALIGRIADVLSDSGHDMLLSRTDTRRPATMARDFETGRARGLIVIGQGNHHSQLNEMAARGIPFVVWGAELGGQDYVTVGGDNLEGGRLATEHLLAQGARRIVFVGDTGLPEISLRHAGYLRAHRDRRLPVPPQATALLPWDRQDLPAAIDQLLTSDPGIDALFVSSDAAAMRITNALRGLGRPVPEDILVVGYDDIAMAAHFHPALTTVGQSTDMAGVALVQTLAAILDGASPASVRLSTQLFCRASSIRGAGRIAAE
ncbi:MAG: LacI family transcriptional regulator [Burkholderiales bacterium PBB4]|nr:MAG: LacI family transcriptional regulator [Burkholderiales bacterium PBB4]